MASQESAKRIVVGISGASGAIYARRTLALLVEAGVEVHLVVSPHGQRLLHDELGLEDLDVAALCGGSQARRDGGLSRQSRDRGGDTAAPGKGEETPQGGDRRGDAAALTEGAGAVVVHPYRNVGAVIASGSFRHEGMVIVPCSSNTLSAVAQGRAENLLHRAAAVALKERRRLVLVHREAPVSLVEIRNMELATAAGAVVMPASPSFYMLPKTVEELVDSVVGRVLDLLGVEHGLNVRWGE